jgi:hypothetical protein
MKTFISGGAQDETDAAEIHNLVMEAAKRVGFPSFELTFGEDSTGDPAVWIWFLIDRADDADEARLRSLRRLRSSVQNALFEHRIARIPYIRFREAETHKG